MADPPSDPSDLPTMANSPPDPAAASSLGEGKRLGDFELIREIGRGGMGVVYESRQTSLNRRVALKILPPGLGLTDTAVRRFEREARAAAKLHHTNIVPVHAIGQESGCHFYAMELVDGRSLSQVLAEMDPGRSGEASDSTATTSAALSGSSSSARERFDTVARLVAEVADGLHYAHGRGVVHRDIKPANLMLNSERRLCVTDFGLARMTQEPGMTVSGSILGTPSYMSPEQIAAGRVKVDHRTDIYSLGAVLYEMLTLQRPFPGDSREEILSGIMTRDPRPPRKINARIPVDLETICLKAMEKDPARRYATAGEMAQDLRNYAQGGLIAARRAGPLRRLNKLVRRHPVAAVSTVALIVILALGGFALRQSSRGAEQAAMRAVSDARFFLAQGDYRKGLDTIDGVLAEAPGLTEARLLRARLLIKLNRYPDAAGEAEALLANDPDDWRGHLILALAAKAPDLGDRVKTLSAEEHMQAVAAGAPETADAFFLQGLFEESDADALELLDRAIELDPTHADALLERCRRQIERRNFQAALLDGERLAALRPRSAQGRRMIGEIHFRLHDTQQALTELERAIRLDPNDPLTLWQRSGVYASLERYEDQLADLTRAIELDPGYARYHEQRAWALMRLGRNQEALADAERAIELNPEFIAAYAALAATYENMGDPAKRVEIYGRLRDESASWNDADARIRALYEAGEVYFRQGDFAALAGVVDEMERLDPDRPDVPVLRIILAKLTGDEAELTAACARLEGIELTDVGEFEMLAMAFGQLCDRPDAGIAVYSKLIAMLPDWADAYAGRARLYADEERYEESLADQARAIALAPRWAEAYRTRSFTYMALERYEEALADIDQFFALGEESGPARQGRAVILLRLGREEEALEDLDRMVAWNPKAGHPYRQRAYVKMQLGRLDEALADAERCLELQPGDTWGYRDRAEYALLLAGSCDKAMRDAQKAQELSDEFDPQQSWWMARFHVSYLAGRCPELYDPAKALELARVPAERLDYGRRTYGLALYRNGRFGEARQVLEEVLEEENPPDPLTLYGLAMTLTRLGDREQAGRLAARARDRVEATWPAGPLYLAYAEEAAALLNTP